MDWNSPSKFKDYPLQDIIFGSDAASFANGQVNSAYKVTAKDGCITYFGSDGRLLGIVDRYNNRITFYHTTLNGQPVINKIKDTLDREVNFSYTSSQVTVTAPSGRTWRYGLQSTEGGKVLLNSVTDPANRVTNYTYSLDNGTFNFFSKINRNVTNVFANLRQVTLPTGGLVRYTYRKTVDNLGSQGSRELYKIDTRADVLDGVEISKATYTYSGEPGGYPNHHNPQQLPTNYTYSGTMTRTDGTSVTTTYNHRHLSIKTETIGTGIREAIETTYRTNKTPATVNTKAYTGGSFAETTVSMTYNDFNNLVSHTDALNRVTTYTYGAYSQPASVVTTRSDGVELRTNYTVATNGNRTLERQVYVENGVTRHADTHYIYDQYGNLTQSRLVMEDGTERITQYEYSSAYKNAYLTKVTVPYGAGSQVTTLEYDVNTGYKTATLDPLNQRTAYQHDTLGRFTRQTYPDNTFRTYAYDDTNRTVTVTLENGTKCMSAYDKIGRLTEERVWCNNAWQVVSKVTYDALSRKSQVENGVGLATSYHYDGGSRVIKTVFPGNLEEITTYNDAARTVSVRDANGNTTLRTFDVLGRITQVQQKPEPHGSTIYTTIYTYDNVGNLLTVTDTKGNITRREYDGLNRIKRFIYPTISPTPRADVVFTYNNAGQKLTETTDSTTQYTYDRRGLLTHITYSDGTYADYTYDIAGRRKGDLASASNISSTYTYDDRNRLTILTRTIDGIPYDLELGYDSVGNVTSILYPGDATPLTQVYDELNRLKAVNGFAGTTNSQGLWYDLAGKLTRMQYNNGIATDYHYNNRGLLSRIQSSVIDLNYTYDSNGNITAINNEVYTYDGLNRLLTASQLAHNYTATYQYDAVGNRISQVENGINTIYNYNAVNELTSSTGTAFTYDRRGNLVQKVQGTDSWLYTYDRANRLIQVAKNGTTLGTYSYDANGIRAKKVEDGENTVYLALGYRNFYEVTNGVATKHIFAGVQRIAEVKDGVVSYFHNDHLGSPRAVTNAAGLLVAAMAITPFGVPHSTNAPTAYRFTGKELDSTGLYYFAARYYDASVGRFVTEDTWLGTRSQPESQNRYVYVINNPLRYIDPTGNVFIDLERDGGGGGAAAKPAPTGGGGGGKGSGAP
ncbi:MAG: RHS repeat-associated core domain-containing protein, partial [Bacillota bacterium]|nr:RHS repeat-associated core domain-containing protein [Bacillota bacterium]